MALTTDAETELAYMVNDADQHSTPRPDAYLDYIDPDKKDMAIRTVTLADGRRDQTFNGRPRRFTYKNFQVVGSDEVLADIGVKGAGSETGATGPGGGVIPGALLTKLNPLKGLDAEGRKQFAARDRELQEHLDNPSDRLVVMDSQGINATVNFAAIPGVEAEFEDDYDGLYANLKAMNRYLGHEWGYNYENRIFTPPFISFADPDGALQLLEDILKIDTPRVIQTSTGPSMHTSPFRPTTTGFGRSATRRESG